MALVNVVNMVVLDNPTCFTNPFQFEITFECLQELDDDLEWKVLYVGSAQDASRDQILDEILVGPVPVGVNKFVLQADAPDPSKLPPEDLLGVTVVLVTCSYKEREFVRVGYYVNNEYRDPNAPAPPPATAPAPAPAPAPTPALLTAPAPNNDTNDQTTTNTFSSSDGQPQEEPSSKPPPDESETDQKAASAALGDDEKKKEGTNATGSNKKQRKNPDDEDDEEDEEEEEEEDEDDGMEIQPTNTPSNAPLTLPNPIPLEHIQRQILADKPRVTKFPIPWGGENEAATAAAATASGANGNGEDGDGDSRMGTTQNATTTNGFGASAAMAE